MSSGKQKLAIGLAIVGVVLLIGPSIIFPGTELIPDATLDREILSGGSMNTYVAKLGAGTWTVTVNQWSLGTLDFDIFITTGLFILPQSIPTTVGDGFGKSVIFTLNESTVVHIRVAESSVYHDSAGFYDIRITGDGETFESVFPISLGFFAFLMVIFFAVPFLIFACICVGTRKQQSRISSFRKRVTETGYTLPRRRSHYEERPDLRTLRLPSKCPTCAADLSDSNIDWTGPMEATCLHCGAVVQAKFERI